MPVYTYKCRKCEHKFELEATIKAKEVGLDASCPDCSSQDTFQTFTRVGFLGGVQAGSGGCSSGTCPGDKSCCG
ncbi:MAG: FmdB family zinc ribbon protein [Bacillota bacterium]